MTVLSAVRGQVTLLVGLIGLAAAGLSADGAAEPIAPPLKDAAANSWVKLAEETSGGRDWPIFHFDPALGQFVLSGGGHEGPVHFDTEFFDLAATKWRNAYPKDAPYKNESGATDAPAVDFRDKFVLKDDANGVMRLHRHLNPYGKEPGTYFQSVYNRDNGKIYAYYQDATLVFDPKLRQWKDLKAERFSKSPDFTLVYGSLAYDPVNKEILSLGGTSDEDGGSPGTWAFSIADSTWKHVPAGASALKGFSAKAMAIHRQTAALTNAIRNRFHLTESEAEAKKDLSMVAPPLAARADDLAATLGLVHLKGAQERIPSRAAPEVARVGAGWRVMAAKLRDPITLELLLEAAELTQTAERAVRALDAEPCGRGITQMATDYKNGKIVLFGGCRLDSYLADTWVYDCKTRVWEQRYPKVCPVPRCGHTLAWLPKSGKVVLYGNAIFSSPYGIAHGNPRPPRDLWSYDIQANEWKLLAQPKDGPIDGPGAVNADDTLVVVSRDPKNKARRITWGMKLDPAAADAGTEKAGVAPGSTTVCFNTPSDFDKAAKPDPASIATLIKDAPANQWTLLPKAPKDPNAHPWGTTPYDTSRHQLLAWGGGHSTWHFNDVAHFSVRSATWSTGYADEFPFAAASFKSMFNQTFNNRPTVPTHVWDAAAYDPVSDKVVFCIRGGTWTYDPATREWDYPAEPRFVGMLDVSMKSTPRGVVHWDNKGKLHLFDAKARAWKPLPLMGGTLDGAYGDNTGICYDSKRDGLWLARDGGPMHQYDLAKGTVTTIPVQRPEFIVMRETAYLPELDMILSAGRTKGPNGELGNLAYDIDKKKWVGIEMPCSDGKPRLNDKPYSSISLALHYDAKLKLLILLGNSQQEVMVARIDKAAVKTFEVKLQEPKKP
ncbi:MAG: hypothetical protein K2R98_01380 [Gemmataceae bacterium]|nr:hypothetical protein [Gemmataceae bacterium]